MKLNHIAVRTADEKEHLSIRQFHGFGDLHIERTESRFNGLYICNPQT